MASEPVNIRLLDREFLVACPAEERTGLIAAANLIDTRMRELRNSAGNPGFDRIAVLVALSITHEFLRLQQATEQRNQAIDQRIDQLQRSLQTTLDGAN